MSENIKTCSFCELLKDVKERAAVYAARQPRINEDHTTECKATLIVENSCNGELGGRTSYNPRELNFCPSCGRKLEKDELCW
jgi:hypothetical protein